jgi:hypothetical protein
LGGGKEGGGYGVSIGKNPGANRNESAEKSELDLVQNAYMRGSLAGARRRLASWSQWLLAAGLQPAWRGREWAAVAGWLGRNRSGRPCSFFSFILLLIFFCNFYILSPNHVKPISKIF